MACHAFHMLVYLDTYSVMLMKIQMHMPVIMHYNIQLQICSSAACSLYAKIMSAREPNSATMPFQILFCLHMHSKIYHMLIYENIVTIKLMHMDI